MKLLYLLSVWVHIVSAVVWLGSALFLALVVVPILRDPDRQGMAASLVRLIGVRMRPLGWIALGLLTVTGVFNLQQRFGWELLHEKAFWHGPVGAALALKLMVTGLILAVSLIHDLWLGPRAGEALGRDPSSPRAGELRRHASWAGRVNVLLGLLAVFLGVVLVRGWL